MNGKKYRREFRDDRLDHHRMCAGGGCGMGHWRVSVRERQEAAETAALAAAWRMIDCGVAVG